MTKPFSKNRSLKLVAAVDPGNQSSAAAWPDVIVVALAGVLAAAIAVLITGLRLGGDSSRFTMGADSLLAGEALVGKQSSYIGYILVVAAAKRVGLGLAGVVALQIAATAAAASAIFVIARTLAGRGGGFIAAGLFVLNPDIVRWNAFILTDSLYIAGVPIVVLLVARAIESLAWRSVVAALVSVALVSSLRPNGWLLVPAVVIVGLSRVRQRAALRATIVLAMVVVGAALFAAVPNLRAKVDAESPARWLQRGQVIWGYDSLLVAMPVDSTTNASTWTDGLSYVARHPLAASRLAAARIAIEVAHIRPFYSLRHNVLVGAFLLALYPLAMMGWWQTRRTVFASVSGALITAQLMLIGITFADWDGRFLLYVLPLIGIFASVAIMSLLPRRRPA